MRPTTYPTKHPYRTAIHEAGHAVVAVLLKVRSHRNGVTIVADDGSLGRAWHRGFPLSFKPDVNGGPLTEERIRRLAKVYLAGHSAEMLAFGTRISAKQSQTDFDETVSLLSYLSAAENEIQPWINLLTVQTSNLLRLPHHWGAVKQLARKLVADRTVRYKTVRGIVAQNRGSAKGPVGDVEIVA